MAVLITVISYVLNSFSDMNRHCADVCCSETSVLLRRFVSSGANRTDHNITYLFNLANDTLLSLVPVVI